jgi:cytochrome P450 family 6
MAYELALNQDIQERLRDEINEVLERHNGEVTYDAIMEMKYLDMVFNETLRKWPVLDCQFRKCESDFKIANTDFVIEAGMTVILPVYGLHNDERFWDEPEKFDPERFNEENVKKIVPYSFIPFGEGPR